MESVLISFIASASQYFILNEATIGHTKRYLNIFQDAFYPYFEWKEINKTHYGTSKDQFQYEAAVYIKSSSLATVNQLEQAFYLFCRVHKLPRFDLLTEQNVD